MEVLKWARSKGCPWDEDVCAFAAEEGHMEVRPSYTVSLNYRNKYLQACFRYEIFKAALEPCQINLQGAFWLTEVQNNSMTTRAIKHTL